MSAQIKPVPDGYHTLTPYLIYQGASEAIEFLKAAFGATEIMRHTTEERGIMHAEVRIGNSPIMLADEAPAMNARSPQYYNGSPVSLRTRSATAGGSRRGSPRPRPLPWPDRERSAQSTPAVISANAPRNASISASVVNGPGLTRSVPSGKVPRDLWR